jgi:hypothetical protein
MGTVARWLVGSSVLLASANAFGEAREAPQPQAPPQVQPQAPVKNPPAAPPTKTAPIQTKAAPKAAAKKAPPKKAPAKAPEKVEKAQQAATQPNDDADAPRCTVVPVKGTPIFEARYANGKKLVLTRLYDTGTFTRLVLNDLRTSCIEAEQLAAIQKALGEAPWVTTKSPPTCKATSNESTAISTAGRLRFTSRQCSPLVLDENSTRALNLVTSYVGPFGLDMYDDLQAN